mmetsp:Transcript_91874/g.275773  ORF Transcript_91874/g.275773 Transcript_91874/m.275773 type:complete len:333 (+) Transcript_91874:461-1459(+)
MQQPAPLSQLDAPPARARVRRRRQLVAAVQVADRHGAHAAVPSRWRRGSLQRAQQRARKHAKGPCRGRLALSRLPLAGRRVFVPEAVVGPRALRARAATAAGRGPARRRVRAELCRAERWRDLDRLACVERLAAREAIQATDGRRLDLVAKCELLQCVARLDSVHPQRRLRRSRIYWAAIGRLRGCLHQRSTHRVASRRGVARRRVRKAGGGRYDGGGRRCCGLEVCRHEGAAEDVAARGVEVPGTKALAHKPLVRRVADAGLGADAALVLHIAEHLAFLRCDATYAVREEHVLERRDDAAQAGQGWVALLAHLLEEHKLHETIQVSDDLLT